MTENYAKNCWRKRIEPESSKSTQRIIMTTHGFVNSLCVFCVLCGSTSAALPELNTIKPRGGQRGQQLVVEFVGDRLGDAQEVFAHELGIQVTKIEPSKNVVKATVQIAADCPLGEHALRIRTATGLSQVRTFWVGALPVI